MSSEQSPGAKAPALPSEDELLRQARALMPAIDAEPRPGFAARVALHASEGNAKPAGAAWWRFAFGGGALVAAAGAVALFFSLHHAPAPIATNINPNPPGAALSELAANDRAMLLRASGGDLEISQHLELYEDLTLLQNEDALEELDVVEVLHQLRPEAKP